MTSFRLQNDESVSRQWVIQAMFDASGFGRSSSLKSQLAFVSVDRRTGSIRQDILCS